MKLARNTPNSALLPLFLAAGIITIMVIAWLAWASWKSVSIGEAVKARAVAFGEIKGDLNYLDEVLTSSARLAAATGDASWEARYEAHVPILEETIANAISVSGAAIAASGVMQTNAANQKLITMEMQAFDLVRQSRNDEALILLQSKEYRSQKALYSSGMDNFVQNLDVILDDKNAADIRNAKLSLFAALLAIMAVVVLWGVIVRLLFGQQKRLAVLNQELERATSAKSEFLAAMSHEIRSPMNGVLGMTGVLMRSGLSAQQQKIVATIKHSGEDLISLLNDILDLSKIESGHVSLEILDFDLQELFASLEAFWASQFQGRNLDFAVDISTDIPHCLKSDPTRIRQILFNLVSNAFKFTSEGGVKITVSMLSAQDDNYELRFAVTDTGIGLSKKAQSKLFSKFVQADSSITRKYGGTGLGLAISRELTGLLGGKIGFESEEERGSTFWFTIQCQRGNAQAVREIFSAELESGEFELPAADRSLRILVAEDNEVNQMVIEAMLRETNHQFDMVSDGLEAIAAVMRSPYDLILMDVQMPQMDGVTATRKIRGLPGKVKNIPIVAVTANAMRGDRENYIDAGMSDYISKPINLPKLAAVLANLNSYNAEPKDPSLSSAVEPVADPAAKTAGDKSSKENEKIEYVDDYRPRVPDRDLSFRLRR